MVEERKTLQSYYDEDKIVFGNHPSLVVRRVATGIKPLDDLLGGGFARNTISQLVGPYSQGKTWTAQKTAASFQDQGLKVFYMNVERAYDPAWWREVGVDIKKLVVGTPTDGEDAIDMAVNVIPSYDLIIIDSLAAMVPNAEVEASADQNFMGLHPRLMGKLCRQVNTVNKDSHIMFINQIRQNIGIAFGNPTMIPGGKALEHYPSTTLVIGREGWIEEGKIKKGWNLKWTINKHRGTANIGDSASIPVLFSGKIDEIQHMIDEFISIGIIKKENSTYKGYDKDTGEELFAIFGKPKLIERLTVDTALYERLVATL